MNVIEKMALKISEGRDCREQASWCVAERGELCECRRQARAALAAALEDMMEPSEGMCAAGLRALSDNGVDASTEGASDPDNPHNDALVCWQAMLDQYEKENLDE